MDEGMGRGDWSVVQSSRNGIGGGCSRMSGVGNGKSCKVEEGLLFLPLFAKKKGVAWSLRGYALRHRSSRKGFNGEFITAYWKNIV